MSFVYALVGILGWGSWMAIAHDVRSPNRHGRILYATLGNLVFSALVFFFSGSSFPRGAFAFPSGAFWLPFAGGFIWGLGGAFSFSAIDHLGLARAVGYWAPANTAWGLAWGALLFGELSNLPLRSYLLLALSFAVLLAGIVLISVPDSGGSGEVKARRRGYLEVAIVGLLWGSYYIPVSASVMPPLAAAFPMSVGMVAADLILALADRKPLVLEKPGSYPRAAFAGVLWGVANTAVLFLCADIGRGRGFAAIQPNLAVSALIGLSVFKEQLPGTPAFRRILLGAFVITLGGILFGFAR